MPPTKVRGSEVGFFARLPKNRRQAFWWWLRSWITWRYLRARWPLRPLRERRLNRQYERDEALLRFQAQEHDDYYSAAKDRPE
jgi:hypothetical protein